MGFPGYFIVMDFINWAQENDIPLVPAVVRALARWLRTH